MEDKFLETFNYRGVSIPVYQNENVYYAILSGRQVQISASESNYRQVLERIISKTLDLFEEIDKDAWIEWFDNGSYRDLRLVCDGRVIQVLLQTGVDVSDRDRQILVQACKERVLAYRQFRKEGTL